MSVWSSNPEIFDIALYKSFDEGRQDTMLEYQALHFIADNTMAIYNCKNALKCFTHESWWISMTWALLTDARVLAQHWAGMIVNQSSQSKLNLNALVAGIYCSSFNKAFKSVYLINHSLTQSVKIIYDASMVHLHRAQWHVSGLV